MKVSPCKSCNERFVGCHSSCVPYKNWKSDYDKVANKIKKEKNRHWESWGGKNESTQH